MWSTLTTREFDDWFAALGESEKVEIAALVGLLKLVGPRLGRPHADTLRGSRFENMKELRGRTENSVFRIAFAFDPARRAVLLVGGSKTGVSQDRFYRQLIAKADRLYAAHLATLKRGPKP